MAVTAQVRAVIGGVLLLATVGCSGSAAPSQQRPNTAAQPRPAAAVLVPQAVGGTGPDGTGAGPAMPTRAGLARELDPLFQLPALGGKATGLVIDPASGTELYAHGARRPVIPASSLKVLTAAAALQAMGPDRRFSTRVVRGGAGEIVLVGGGDPALASRAPKGDRTRYPAPASLQDLAERTARALAGTGGGRLQLRYDDSLFRGTGRNPDWETSYTVKNVAPVTALMADQGRRTPENPAKTDDPAAQAAHYFAKRLGEHGIRVGKPTEGRAPAGAQTLAKVDSPPLAVLVERMLSESDNDYAEAVARQTALAKGMEASFAGGGQAVRRSLSELGMDTGALRLLDGSGLARGNQVTAEALARALALAAGPASPRLRPVTTGLPVAGFTGTLDDRFRHQARPAIGYVRAKTGTLTGVNSLTGLVRDQAGRLLVFAFVANEVAPANRETAAAGLDRLAAAVAGCGC